MKAGRLRHWLTFEAPTTTLDSDGAQVEVWADAFSVNSRMPCELVALSGRELIAAAAVQSKVSVRIRCRYRAGFAANWRAVADDGTVWNIEAVIPDPDSRIRWVSMTTSQGVNEG